MREEVVEEEEKCQHHLDRACTLGKGASFKGYKYSFPLLLSHAVADWPKIRPLTCLKEAKIVTEAELICDDILDI